MKNIDKLRNWLNATNYDLVVIGRRDNFKWITEGYDTAVVTNVDTGVAYMVLHKEGKGIDSLIADSSDAARVGKEQNPLGLHVIEVPWYENMGAAINNYCIEETAVGMRCASDTGLPKTVNVLEELIDLRMELSSEEVEKYRKLGQDCAAIVEGVAIGAQKGDSEIQIANRVKKQCFDKGISPDCVIVGCDNRIFDYRHPMPTEQQIEKSVMVVLGGERHGLNISMTRIVYFDYLPAEIQERMERTQEVFAKMQLAMTEGLAYGDYFRMTKEFYDEAGYDGEWKFHHQGGPTGYGCREFIINGTTKKVIREHQAYAWNPTIQGTKCEETTYLADGKVEIFTQTDKWPRRMVETDKGSVSVASIYVK